MFGRLLVLMAVLTPAGCANVETSRTPPPASPDAELNIADVDVYVEPLPGLFQGTD